MSDVMSPAKEARRLRWAERYPELGTDPLPTSVFTSEDHFRDEVEKIFKKTWLQVGRVEEIPNAHDFKIRRLDFAEASAVIMRNKDGSLKAFHNICSHRGNKPISETGFDTFGNVRSGKFECRFHGWVYDTAGTLVHVPEEDHFPPCFSRAENGLTPIACDVWEGFIFINLDPKPDQDLKTFLGGLGEHLSGYPYGELTNVYRYQQVVRCNWKVALDAFSESYHVPYLHRYLWPEAFGTTLEGIKFFGPHRTSEVFLDPASMKVTDVGKIANAVTENSLGQSRPVKVMLPPQVNPEARADFAFELSAFFPNFMVHIGEGTCFTHNFYPIDVNTIMWEGTSYIHQSRTNREMFAEVWAEKMQLNNWLEDSATMEITQEALRSGAKDVFWLHDEEVLIRHSHKMVEHFISG